MVKRGEIWLVHLNPTQGSEIRKTRPCAALPPAEMHDYLRTAIVAPMTTKGFSAPFRIPLTHAGKRGLVLLDQVRTIDKTRLTRKQGTVSPETLRAILATLRMVFEE